jgi:hypothetical protein
MTRDKETDRALDVARSALGEPVPADLAARATKAVLAEAQLVERVLGVARETHAAPVPAGVAERAARAALTAPVPTPGWWRVALPIAWRAAVGVNFVGASVLAWVLVRGDGPREHAPRSAVDNLVDAETSAVLSRALGLDAEVSR